MNLVTLASQAYSMFLSSSNYSELKKKSSQLLIRLQTLRISFEKENIQHPMVEMLASLVYSFVENSEKMKIYGYDAVHNQYIINQSNNIERSIDRAFFTCNQIMEVHKKKKMNEM